MQEDGVRRELEEETVARLALAQGLLGPLALADVAPNIDQRTDVRVVELAGEAGLDRHPVIVAPPDPVLEALRHAGMGEGLAARRLDAGQILRMRRGR
ncbi:MAG: hypothetical protein HKUEN07_25570 [Rhodocyclaceae bacterium]|nr:MAG: hypothetical protein HKUEN07_25570 [Rhodocyclaceae bacterium]